MHIPIAIILRISALVQFPNLQSPALFNRRRRTNPSIDLLKRNFNLKYIYIMSPASSSKSKEKKSARVHVNASFGIPASGYNPLSGTFHTFESGPLSTVSSPNVNGRFRNIDDTEDHYGNPLGAGIEYDVVSNNGSWSGESEDHKEKVSQPLRQESVLGADNDKREKIRLKNERKHQRQKERRAQELHERCSGYLMSRKLEALAQQLVAMGFSQERATMALILNEGRVEESVSWLFDSVEEDKHVEHNLDTGGNLKIDISEELVKITDMEIRYKASKQEVERAIVAYEGDIDKAEEMLKASKQEHTTAHVKSEETGDPPTAYDSKRATAAGQTVMKAESKTLPSASIQPKRDDKDFNYTKVSSMMGPSVDSEIKGMQASRKTYLDIDWSKTQPNISADRRWAGNDLKNLQLGSMREPVIIMQRPQFMNTRQVPSTTSAGSSPPGSNKSWQPNNVDMTKKNGSVTPAAISAVLGPNGVNSHPLYNQLQFQPQQQLVSDSSLTTDHQLSSRTNVSWHRGGASPTLSAASSLGLFSNGSSSASSSAVDWNTGSSMVQFDYTNVDWSLDLSLLTSRSNGLWRGGQNGGVGNGNGTAVPVPVRVLADGGMGSSDPVPGGSREQRGSEKDLFSFPRQFVSSPSL